MFPLSDMALYVEGAEVEKYSLMFCSTVDVVAEVGSVFVVVLGNAVVVGVVVEDAVFAAKDVPTFDVVCGTFFSIADLADILISLVTVLSVVDVIILGVVVASLIKVVVGAVAVVVVIGAVVAAIVEVVVGTVVAVVMVGVLVAAIVEVVVGTLGAAVVVA